ncbi:unnamed protein product [Rodentolepis nana]|uniref:DUF4258 domain-containing protein n=1 Tax=Rodentolepis nana TaxID=102285 RepID=A0A0R3TD64_RODNA|nr:unnamed protein product [Rodentolepis nana]
MLESSSLELIHTDADSATYLQYHGIRTTPDLLVTSSEISEHTRLKIIDDDGSGHKSVIITKARQEKCQLSYHGTSRIISHMSPQLQPTF